MKVRLRAETVSLPVALDVEGRGVIRAVLKPGVVTDVDPLIYDYLKKQFGGGSRRVVVPDGQEAKPHKIGEEGETRSENVFDHETYVIEFLG